MDMALRSKDDALRGMDTASVVSDWQMNRLAVDWIANRVQLRGIDYCFISMLAISRPLRPDEWCEQWIGSGSS
jgi:hypothetical protein